MIQKRAKHSLFVAMLVTVPCPSVFLFCNGLLPVSARLSETQQLLVSCLYTRHCDGFVRERHLRTLLSSTHTWVAPFVFALIGEYVVEIIQVIEQQATMPMKEHLAQFGTGDSKFCALTRRRVVSYWDCYYRTRFRFEDYPAVRLLDILGLWPNNEARSLRTG
jgi:hypothetical protein